MLQRNNTAVFGLAMWRQSGAVMLHVSLWKLQVRFASDVEKKNAPKSIDNELFQSEDGFALQV